MCQVKGEIALASFGGLNLQLFLAPKEFHILRNINFWFRPVFFFILLRNKQKYVR